MLVATCGSGQVAGSDSASSPPCLRGRPVVPGWRGGTGSCITRSLRSRPSSSHRQVRQQPGQPGHVVAGVEDDQDRRVAFPPVPGLDQPGDDLADLDGRDLGLVVIRAQPHGVQHRGPGGAARLQRRDHRVRPARDHLRLALARGRRRGRTAAPGWSPRPAAASCSHPRPAQIRPSGQAGGSQARPAPGAAGRSRPGRSSPRHTARRGRAGAPGPATAPPASGPARPRTAPHRPAPNSSSARAARQAWKSTRNRDSSARDSTSPACF